MEIPTPNYFTKDFYSACLLKATGYSFSSLEKGSDRFSLFIFSDPKGDAQETVSRYWNRQLQIEAKDLTDAIHDMKTILYSK